MTIANIGFMKPAMFMSPLIVIGLAVMSCGCASTQSPATASAVGNPPLPMQPAQTKPSPATAAKNDPVAESVFIASALAQMGDYLFSGK